MIKLTIGEQEYDLPENYDELSLGKFITLSKILEDKKNDSDFKFSLNLISTIIGCEIDTLYGLNLNDMNTLIKEVNWITQTPLKKKTKKIIVEGVEYGFLDLNGITTGEMISVESFNTNLKDNKDNIHLVLSILFRPIVNGKITPLESDYNVILERAELFKNKMMIGEVYGPLINFMNGGTGSTIKNLAPSSALKMRKVKANS